MHKRKQGVYAMMPFGLKIAIINREFRKRLDEKASTLGLTSVQLRFWDPSAVWKRRGKRRSIRTIWSVWST